MKSGANSFKKIEAGMENEWQQRETLADLAIFGGLVYDSQTIRDVTDYCHKLANFFPKKIILC